MNVGHKPRTAKLGHHRSSQRYVRVPAPETANSKQQTTTATATAEKDHLKEEKVKQRA
jgi:hypothetical protein